MRILAIDPGTTQSAWLVYDSATRLIASACHEDNERVVALIQTIQPGGSIDHLAIEGIGCQGQLVGASTIDTAIWIGQFIRAWGGPYNIVLRRQRWGPGPMQYGDGKKAVYASICARLCNTVFAKDKNVRQALMDRFPATGGGKTPQKGTKKRPGPLYGIGNHLWSALAVAITFAEAQAGD